MNKEDKEMLTRLKKEYTNLFNVIKSHVPQFPSMWMNSNPANIEAENKAIAARVKENQCNYIRANAGRISRLGELHIEILSIDKNALN